MAYLDCRSHRLIGIILLASQAEINNTSSEIS
jgi:hypothetical protein